MESNPQDAQRHAPHGPTVSVVRSQARGVPLGHEVLRRTVPYRSVAGEAER